MLGPKLEGAMLPRSIQVRVTLFRATEMSSGREEPQDCWGKLAAGGLETHLIPGYFSQTVYEPRVRVLAEKLTACLDRGQASGLSTKDNSPERVRDFDIRKKVMKICLVAPVSRWRGGIHQYSVQLANNLAITAEVEVVSYKSIFPLWLYPGESKNISGELAVIRGSVGSGVVSRSSGNPRHLP